MLRVFCLLIITSFCFANAEDFFKEVIQNTSAGYVLYGEKPVYLHSIPKFETLIPGTKEHYYAVHSLLLAKSLPKKHLDIIFAFPNKEEFLIIHQQNLLQVIQKNLPLFQSELGKVTPEKVMQDLIEKGFAHLFTGHIALQGIVLGYGTKNSLTYEKMSRLKKQLEEEVFPFCPKDEKEMTELFKNHPLTKNYWKEIEDFTHYSSGNLKIPFSFHQNSQETKKILAKYEKAQEKIDSFDPEEFIKKKGKTCDSLSVLAKYIFSIHSSKIPEEFIEGMRDAENEKGPSKSFHRYCGYAVWNFYKKGRKLEDLLIALKEKPVPLSEEEFFYLLRITEEIYASVPR